MRAKRHTQGCPNLCEHVRGRLKLAPSHIKAIIIAPFSRGEKAEGLDAPSPFAMQKGDAKSVARRKEDTQNLHLK